MKKLCINHGPYDYSKTSCPNCTSDSQRRYDSGRENIEYDHRWRQFAKKLKKEFLYSVCWNCLYAQNKFVYKIHLHHIKSISSHPHLKYNRYNLISLCGSCHNKVENRPQDFNLKNIQSECMKKLTNL
jgi:5-methylcytosine-specific restriction endonuclease McrA